MRKPAATSLRLIAACTVFGAGTCFGGLAPVARAANAPFRVVIDPGHGGTDQGTVYFQNGRRIMEKDLTLLLAQSTARLLRARGFLVTLTRNEDRDISLPSRTALANRLRADIFLSIHMNSTPAMNAATAARGLVPAEGIETYILNNATNASSERLAKLENLILPQKGAAPTAVAAQGDVALILKDLRLDANLSESKRLACAVQEKLVTMSNRVRTPAIPAPEHPRLRDRGVKQALFYVLLGADMPSVLVEAGFLNSARDRAMVLQPLGRRALGLAIASAVDLYRQQRDHSRLGGSRTANQSFGNPVGLSKCKVN